MKAYITCSILIRIMRCYLYHQNYFAIDSQFTLFIVCIGPSKHHHNRLLLLLVTGATLTHLKWFLIDSVIIWSLVLKIANQDIIVSCLRESTSLISNTRLSRWKWTILMAFSRRRPEKSPSLPSTTSNTHTTTSTNMKIPAIRWRTTSGTTLLFLAHTWWMAID